MRFAKNSPFRRVRATSPSRGAARRGDPAVGFLGRLVGKRTSVIVKSKIPSYSRRPPLRERWNGDSRFKGGAKCLCGRVSWLLTRKTRTRNRQAECPRGQISCFSFTNIFPKKYKNKTTRFRVVLNEMRQRPMLPVGGPTSTFGAGKLNFCVRNGNRWILSAMVTAMVYITLFRAEYIYIVSEDSQLHSRLFKQRTSSKGLVLVKP